MSAPIVEQATTPEYKVFIGNLSFKTTKEALRSFAESTGGKVAEATIITKGGTRSLGYGFVTFVNEEDMKKAAVELNHKELDGREINVEVARPKTVPTTTTATTTTTTTTTTKESNDKAPRKRNTRRKSKTLQKKKSETNSSDEEPSKVSSSNSSSSEELPTHRQTSQKKSKQQQQQKKTRASSNKKKSDDRPSSKTTLFVANLPYATTDDDIKKIFEAYKVVSAHVTRMNNGRSKGYGFVEFESEEEQQRALQGVKDIQLDGRAVYLKVALSDPKEAVVDELSEKVEALDVVDDTKK